MSVERIAFIALCLMLAPQLASAGEIPDSGAAAASNAFALDLHARLARDPGNLVYSPLSIALALGMTYEGARGRTADQMAAVLHLSEAGDSAEGLNLGGLMSRLPLGSQEEGCQLLLANRLWGGRDLIFQRAFLDAARNEFQAPLEQLDFQAGPEGARRTINAWIARQTRDKIPELLQPGDVERGTALVLTNAIYFYGPWEIAFSARSTRPAPFHLEAGHSVEVPTMVRQDRFQHVRLAEAELLQLPYSGGDLAMTVLLPPPDAPLASLEEKLDPERLDSWLNSLRPEELRVELPRFQLDGRFELNKVLTALGMIDAFGPQADFSGMTSQAKLSIDKVIHQAWIEVNEEGTEAAAATAVTMKRASLEQTPVFKADRPFLFLIRDLGTGTILFLGRVADPRG